AVPAGPATADGSGSPSLVSTTNAFSNASPFQSNSPAPPRPSTASSAEVVSHDQVLSHSEARVVGLGNHEALTHSPEAATLTRQLHQAHARGGDIQFSIMWHNYNDLDLHCVDPAHAEISFINKKSASGGELDVDQNAHQPFNANPVENIYWPFSGAPPGQY